MSNKNTEVPRKVRYYVGTCTYLYPKPTNLENFRKPTHNYTLNYSKES